MIDIPEQQIWDQKEYDFNSFYEDVEKTKKIGGGFIDQNQHFAMYIMYVKATLSNLTRDGLIFVYCNPTVSNLIFEMRGTIKKEEAAKYQNLVEPSADDKLKYFVGWMPGGKSCIYADPDCDMNVLYAGNDHGFVKLNLVNLDKRLN